MAWRALTVEQLAGKFTPPEIAALKSTQNSDTEMANALTTVIREYVGGMQAAGYPVAGNDYIPDQLRRHIEAAAVWNWLRSFPQLKAFKTDERKQAAADAEKIYDQIVQRKYGAIESPNGTDITTGNWNSENKLIMRTHPVPSPNAQFPETIIR